MESPDEPIKDFQSSEESAHRVSRWAGQLLGLAIYGLAATLRARILYPEREVPRREGAPGRIYSLWHGRMLYPAFFRRKLNAAVLVSLSRDGEILAGVLGTLGYRTVRGSTSRGGGPALRRLIRTLRDGQDIGIASDGPRGPANQVQPGILQLASLTSAPILPIVFGAAHAKMFDSWDRLCLPLPFTRVAVVFGRPVRVARDTDKRHLERKRLELEAEMLWAQAAADAAVEGCFAPPEPPRDE